MSYSEGLLVLPLLVLFLLLRACNAQSYKAVVVPYNPISGQRPDKLVQENIPKYVALINDLKDQADIVVFPENGLSSLKPITLPKAHLQPFSINLLNTNTLSNISTAAKSSELYVVINVLELDSSTEDMKFYSTDVVFDTSGHLIKKCRKKHLYKEQNYNRGDITQDCTFEANFPRINRKVTFDLLFDTDLVYKYEKTHDAILTSSLPNELPFSFGLSLQLGFSVSNQVNLLTSACAEPGMGYGGSGIYLRDGKSYVTIGTDYLLGEVPIDNKSYNDVVVKVTSSSKGNTLSNIAYEDLTKLSNATDYCKLQMNENDRQPYRWVTLKNNIFLGQNKTVIICALIKPEENRNQKKTVKDVTISTDSKNVEDLEQLLPLSLGVKTDSSMVPANFQFVKKQDGNKISVTMTLREESDLLVFGVVFVTKSGSFVHVSQMFFVIILPILVSFCT